MNQTLTIQTESNPLSKAVSLYNRLILRGDSDLEYRAYLLILSIKQRTIPEFASYTRFFQRMEYLARQNRKDQGRLDMMMLQLEAQADQVDDKLSELERDIQEVRDALMIPFRSGSNQQKHESV